MTAPPVPATFIEHASVPAIEIQLNKARRARASWDRRVLRLALLLEERHAQIAAGNWPGQPRGDQP